MWRGLKIDFHSQLRCNLPAKTSLMQSFGFIILHIFPSSPNLHSPFFTAKRLVTDLLLKGKCVCSQVTQPTLRGVSPTSPFETSQLVPSWPSSSVNTVTLQRRLDPLGPAVVLRHTCFGVLSRPGAYFRPTSIRPATFHRAKTC